MATAIRPHRAAFFICDIQERFRQAIYSFDDMAGTARKLVRAAKLLDVPVYATEQNPKALGVTIPEVEFQTVPTSLNPLGSALPKTKFSMYIPELEESLHQRGIKSVVLCGIETHVCVLQTCLDLLANDFQVHVVADGVSSCNAQEIPIALERMRQAGAKITSSESIIFQIMGDALHPNFKAVSKLIKDEKETTRKALTKLPPLHSRL